MLNHYLAQLDARADIQPGFATSSYDPQGFMSPHAAREVAHVVTHVGHAVMHAVKMAKKGTHVSPQGEFASIQSLLSQNPDLAERLKNPNSELSVQSLLSLKFGQ